MSRLLPGLERKLVAGQSSSSKLVGLGPRMRAVLGRSVQQVQRMIAELEPHMTAAAAGRTIAAQLGLGTMAGLGPRTMLVGLVLGMIGQRLGRRSSLSTMGSPAELVADKSAGLSKFVGLAQSSSSKLRQVLQRMKTVVRLGPRTIVGQVRRTIVAGHMIVVGRTIVVQVPLGSWSQLERCSLSNQLVVAGRLAQLVARSFVAGSSGRLIGFRSSAGQPAQRMSFAQVQLCSLIGRLVLRSSSGPLGPSSCSLQVPSSC